jgi:hypothetical protein
MKIYKGKKFGPDAARGKKSPVGEAGLLNAEELAKRERYFSFFLAAALLCFGIYHSVLYFGHTIIPISDFPAFFQTGKELLSLHAPSSYKRGPVLGVLQVLLSYLVDGRYPDLTAGWLLNAVLHPFNLLLFWLVGREIIGRPAVWFAIIAILNPWVLYMLTEPIVETTLLFFVLLSFYLMFRRSRWCYLFASIASMSRYEGAMLIAAAFVMDMIYAKNRRERILAFVYSATASAPLGIWILATFLSWDAQTSSDHYFKIFGADSEYSKLLIGSYKDKVGVALHMKLEWRTGFQSLLTPYPEAGKDFGEVVQKLSKTLAAGGFFFGCIYGLCKRQWKILALLIFFVPYFAAHAMFPAPLPRYHMTIFWIALLISWFGLQNIWKLIDKDNRVPRLFVYLLQAMVVIIALVWVAGLFPYLPQAASISPTSASVPYVATAVTALILGVRIYIHKFKYLLRELAIFTLLGLVFISNQFALASILGDGQREIEFKLLGDWFADNAKPGEKMGLYMAGVVKTFAGKYADNVVGLPKADSPSEFVEACYKENITYVVWATREGLSNDHADYRGGNLHTNIALLGEPRNIGPYKFVTQVGTKRGFVNIFRLMRPGESAN